MKRKAPVTPTTSGTSKRAKIHSGTGGTHDDGGGAESDPARKYCLGKLKEIMCGIWKVQRPFVRPVSLFDRLREEKEVGKIGGDDTQMSMDDVKVDINVDVDPGDVASTAVMIGGLKPDPSSDTISTPKPDEAGSTPTPISSGTTEPATQTQTQPPALSHPKEPTPAPAPNLDPNTFSDPPRSDESDSDLFEQEGEHNKRNDIEANRYAVELESCLFDIYGEVGAGGGKGGRGKGKKIAGGKYK